jgi:hypothetical protein
MTAKRIEWIDRGLEPTQPANPAYPNGITVDVSNGARAACLVTLPYPAKRIGAYAIRCECGASVAVTTAGRRDDPRSVKIACKLGATGQFGPEGKVRADDEGELKCAISFDAAKGQVFLDFGKAVTWLSLPPAQAIKLAETLLQKAGAKFTIER